MIFFFFNSFRLLRKNEHRELNKHCRCLAQHLLAGTSLIRQFPGAPFRSPSHLPCRSKDTWDLTIQSQVRFLVTCQQPTLLPERSNLESSVCPSLFPSGLFWGVTPAIHDLTPSPGLAVRGWKVLASLWRGAGLRAGTGQSCIRLPGTVSHLLF